MRMYQGHSHGLEFMQWLSLFTNAHTLLDLLKALLATGQGWWPDTLRQQIAVRAQEVAQRRWSEQGNGEEPAAKRREWGTEG